MRHDVQKRQPHCVILYLCEQRTFRTGEPQRGSHDAIEYSPRRFETPVGCQLITATVCVLRSGIFYRGQRVHAPAPTTTILPARFPRYSVPRSSAPTFALG